MSISDDDLDTVLRKWSKDKARLAELETRIEKYKKIVGKVLDKRETDTLEGTDYTLKRRQQTRTSISKVDVPPDVWSRYAKKVSYQAFFLSEN